MTDKQSGCGIDGGVRELRFPAAAAGSVAELAKRFDLDLTSWGPRCPGAYFQDEPEVVYHTREWVYRVVWGYDC